MKRIISLVLCLAMLASLNSFAFAASASKKNYSGSSSQRDGKIPVSSAVASSELIENGRRYGADNLVDGDTSSCWAEGAYGYGKGETFTVYFDGTYDVSRFSIASGWTANSEAWEKNGRPKTMNVYFSSSPESYYEVKLDNTSSIQTLWVDEYDVKWVQFELVSVYKGWDGIYDTCISEVTFYE